MKHFSFTTRCMNPVAAESQKKQYEELIKLLKTAFEVVVTYAPHVEVPYGEEHMVYTRFDVVVTE